MHITLAFAPLVSLIAGLLILIVPRLLNYIVGIYLIIIRTPGTFRCQQLSPAMKRAEDTTRYTSGDPVAEMHTTTKPVLVRVTDMPS